MGGIGSATAAGPAIGALITVFKVLLALFPVLAVLVLRFVFKLPLLPFRAIRSLLKGRSAPA